MTRTEIKLIDTFATLGFALTGKTPKLAERSVADLVEGAEVYLPDGGYSRIFVSMTTGKAHLTDNSRQQVKDAWVNCKELIADLERYVRDIRKPLGWEAAA